VPVAIMASFCLHECNPGRTTIVRSPIEVSVASGKAHREVRDKTRPNSNIKIVRGSRKGLNRAK